MPALLPIWAASGAIATPDNSKIAQGWLISEKPPHEYMNWWMNLVTWRVNHVLQNGVALWDATVTYPANAFCRQSGLLWRALAENINTPPASNPDTWLQVTQNASALSTGSVPNARLTGNYTNIAGLTVAGNINFGGNLNGSGANLTNLNADNLASGTVPNARLAGNYTGITHLTASGNVTANRFNGSGAGLTSLNADELVAGTVSPSRLNGNYAFNALTLAGLMTADRVTVTNWIAAGSNITAVGNVTANNFVGSGQGLSNINGSMIATGTVASARLPAPDDGSERARILSHIGNSLIGAAGTTILARYDGSGNVEPGANVNGANLRPANVNGDVSLSSTSMNGIWKCKGVVTNGGNNAQRTTLWMRVTE